VLRPSPVRCLRRRPLRLLLLALALPACSTALLALAAVELDEDAPEMDVDVSRCCVGEVARTTARPDSVPALWLRRSLWCDSRLLLCRRRPRLGCLCCWCEVCSSDGARELSSAVLVLLVGVSACAAVSLTCADRADSPSASSRFFALMLVLDVDAAPRVDRVPVREDVRSRIESALCVVGARCALPCLSFSAIRVRLPSPVCE
jgi:hypothetical protein